ncbi:SulP family inorganic anion transporter [Alteromonas halophila]|uniref:Anti-sigma factor antagonist n=1 Tax=Alteromonas halophila TaxID=516698 RepID=A0A918JCA4_9ALTE|nr:SulP family inorganic anion transporter [Alteromonas halophila]GGW73872.1 anti-sigma factor antagonist [Alteromonas halophila]
MKLDLSNMRGDITGGITAGIVALPLALAFGVASGLGPIAGMYGAIAVGFFASLFGGTPSQISGPTGPMVVVLAGLFASLSGSATLIFTAVILAGVVQIVMGALKLGDYIRLVPYPVISGFMSGIGVIIISLQLVVLLGDPSPSSTIGAINAMPEAIAGINPYTIGLGLLTLVIAYKWPASLTKYVPSTLAALIIGTIASLALVSFAGATVPILGQIPTGLPSLIMPEFTKDSIMLVVEAAVILAVLGAIDSLLTSLVADNMTRTRHDSNQELIGQGVGNTVAGFIGGIAGAGATMRTFVNIRSGGRYKISGMVHALLLLAIVLGLGGLASHIPHAVLGGILVKAGADIIDWSYIRRAHRGPRFDLLIMAVVLGMTVFVDLIQAVGVGVVLAALAYVKQVAATQLDQLRKMPEHLDNEEEAELLKKAEGKVAVFDFGSPLSFGAAADVGHHVRQNAKRTTQVLILDFERVPFMDVSAARAVETIATDAVAAGRVLLLSSVKDNVANVLKGLGADAHLTDRAFFKNRYDALLEAVKLAEEKSSEGGAPGGPGDNVPGTA